MLRKIERFIAGMRTENEYWLKEQIFAYNVMLNKNTVQLNFAFSLTGS